MARVVYGVWDGVVHDGRERQDGDAPELPGLKGFDSFNEGNRIRAFFGDRGFLVLDARVHLTDALWRYMQKAADESCGKCTPCREGTFWLTEIFERLLAGNGTMADIDLLGDIADNIMGKSFCALGDAAAMPIQGALKHFRHEFEYLVQHKTSLVNRRKAEIMEVSA